MSASSRPPGGSALSGGFPPWRAVDPVEAVAILTVAAGLDHDPSVADIAALVGQEPPALRWAAALARTTGWRPLRERLARWTRLAALFGAARLPWEDEVEAAIAARPPREAELLAITAACDVAVSWDVLEDVATARVEDVAALEDAGLLVRSTDAGVVTFAVPWCVRAVRRAREPEASARDAARWLDAWVTRAVALRPRAYGPGAEATLVELLAAAPLAEQALADGDPAVQRTGLALWLGVADALFFAERGAFDVGSPSFATAVAVADATGDASLRARARVVAGRAALERADPGAAAALFEEAAALGGDEHRCEALRGRGWAELASARLAEATRSFDAAHALAESARDPRGAADATAGKGIAALLRGDPDPARALLSEALATHLVMRDAPREGAVRAMLALLPQACAPEIDEARLAAELAEVRRSGQRWREALLLARRALAARARGDRDGERAHLAEARAAASISRMPASALATAVLDGRSAVAQTIAVGNEGRSLRVGAGEVHDLTRHGPLRRVLWALAVARSSRPGAALSTNDVVEAGWPGEKMRHQAATLRVYTTIRRLRAHGLGDALLTRDDGYLLDPEVPVALVTGPLT